MRTLDTHLRERIISWLIHDMLVRLFTMPRSSSTCRHARINRRTWVSVVTAVVRYRQQLFTMPCSSSTCRQARIKSRAWVSVVTAVVRYRQQLFTTPHSSSTCRHAHIKSRACVSEVTAVVSNSSYSQCPACRHLLMCLPVAEVQV